MCVLTQMLALLLVSGVEVTFEDAGGVVVVVPLRSSPVFFSFILNSVPILL